MGKEFFNGWELWQKMTFVLGCGIVATIIIGLFKLQYDKYRIAKYSKVDKGKQVVQTPAMLEAQNEETKESVPFGIRAIESGIEVDGVWISRSNTPAGSTRSSVTDFKLPRSDSSSQIEYPQGLLSSSRPSSKAASSFDVAVGAERIATNDSRSSSPGRGRPPVSMNRYSYNVNRTLQALEGPSSNPSSSRREPIGDTPSSGSSQENSGKSSRRTSDESDPEGRPYEPAHINPKQPAVYMPVDPRTDLDLLQSHRMSHVAETGQLTPRPRFKPGQSGEWANLADNLKLPEEIGSANGVDYFVPQQKAPSPPPPVAAPAPAPIPVPSDVSPAMESSTTKKAKQAVPLLESYAPRPFYVPDVYLPKGPQHQMSYDEMPIEVNTSQNQRDDNGKVLRKVNSGFEILKPGTLPSPVEEQPALAPAEKRQSKRLQKKRRTSSASTRASQFVEQI